MAKKDSISKHGPVIYNSGESMAAICRCQAERNPLIFPGRKAGILAGAPLALKKKIYSAGGRERATETVRIAYRSMVCGR